MGVRTIDLNIREFSKVCVDLLPDSIVSNVDKISLELIRKELIRKGFRVTLLGKDQKEIYTIQPTKWGENYWKVTSNSTTNPIKLLVEDQATPCNLYSSWREKDHSELGMFLGASFGCISVISAFVLLISQSAYSSGTRRIFTTTNLQAIGLGIIGIVCAIAVRYFNRLRSNARFNVINKLISMVAFAQIHKDDKEPEFQDSTPLIVTRFRTRESR